MGETTDDALEHGDGTDDAFEFGVHAGNRKLDVVPQRVDALR